MCFRQTGLGKQARRQAPRNFHCILYCSMILKHGGAIPHPPSHVNRGLQQGLEYRPIRRTALGIRITWMLRKFCNVGEGSPTRRIGPRTSAKTRKWGRSMKTPRR